MAKGSPKPETVGTSAEAVQPGQATDQADKLIEQLREAIRVRDDFLAIATHELRNPLTPILLGLQLIRAAEKSGDKAKLMQEIDRLERQIKHFVARTNTLLEVAQVTSGKFHLDPSEVNLSGLIAEIVNDYMPLAIRSGSKLSAKVQNDVIGLLDRTAVSGIVENLLSNAIKYGQGKPIEINLSATPEIAQITVRDHGIGIDEKDKARIFERFERAVGRHVQSGFGIGLWLSRSFVELMGGSITVFGEPGAGSMFTVSLPLESEGKP
ncbi:MAG: HAMP domain-containing sensor histidine kinase [Candidatus Binatus sp.]|uniref:sensor histidine kinase n=1 Tax=Candidatus Binatus sp. TaxID=2811406 RepID=UPI003BB1A2AB